MAQPPTAFIDAALPDAQRLQAAALASASVAAKAAGSAAANSGFNAPIGASINPSFSPSTSASLGALSAPPPSAWSAAALGAHFSASAIARPGETRVWIDPAVPDGHILRQAVAQSPAGPGAAVHLFSHGKPGQLFINGQWMGPAEIAAWLLESGQLQGQEQLNIYGCNFAEGVVGMAAVNYLEKALGLSVAASTNTTGKDGDWVLEAGISTATITPINYPENLQIQAFASYSNLLNPAGQGNATLNASFGAGITATISASLPNPNCVGFGDIIALTNPYLAVNFPSTFFAPQPPNNGTLRYMELQSDRNGFVAGCSGVGTVVLRLTIVFNQSVTNPVFHFLNLDDAGGSFSNTPGLSSITRVSGNNEFQGFSGLQFHQRTTKVAWANLGGCESNSNLGGPALGYNSGGLPANGACGSIRLNGSFTTVILEFTDAVDAFPQGDGFLTTISLPVTDLAITKTNTPLNGNTDQAIDTVVRGADTTYQIRVTNNGPMLSVTGAVVKDTPTGLTCNPTAIVTCTSGSPGACPATTQTAAQLLGAGITLGELPLNGTATLSLTCTVN